jgi:hypothetical protein
VVESVRAAAAPVSSAPTSDSGSTSSVAADERPAAVAAALVINVSVLRACWISATVDGLKQFERILQPGDRRTVDVHRDLVLTAGDAGAVSMTINGAEAKPLGKDGQVVTARLNLANFKSFLPAQ